jgi:hypothetical protein
MGAALSAEPDTAPNQRRCDPIQILWPVRQRGARIMGAVALTPTRSGSGEADIARASQVQHTIEDVGGDVHLGRPTLIRMRA